MKTKLRKNTLITELVADLKKLSIDEKTKFWKKIALELERPARNKRAVNISRINQHTKENETIIVPGKVLSSGDIDHPVNVCAYAFSKDAEKKLSQKGKILSIRELMKKNPKATNIRIIG